jgi:ADP-heptose:LPS heptosyltransferase
MHIAAALGIPTVGIFALKEDFPQRWRPLGERTAVVRPDKIPCTRHCQKALCPRFSCYEAVTAEMVIQGVEAAMRGKSGEEQGLEWEKKSSAARKANRPGATN